LSPLQFFIWTGVVTGIFWTATYILIIVRGFQDRTYGMPPAAMCANLSWEFVFGFVQPIPVPQVFVNRAWFVFDLVLLAQYLRYWRTDYPANLARRWFLPTLALTLVTAFGLVLLTSREFNDRYGQYPAFGQNLMMSILFITMLLRRDSLLGQGFYIALFKMLGTIVSSLGFSVFEPRLMLLNFLYVTIFVFDAIYLVAVYRKCRELGVNPWTDLVRTGGLGPTASRSREPVIET
jgi:hypothetical protein